MFWTRPAAGARALFFFQKRAVSGNIHLTMKRKLVIAAALVALPLLSSGCVSRSTYEDNVNQLMQKMHRERAEGNADRRALEIKVQERGRTLSELTTRYMDLKAQQDYSQAKLGRLQNDLEGLLRDMSEMKLVIFTNFKGTQANELMLKLNSMQKTVQEILRKSGEAMPAPAPADAEPQGQGSPAKDHM